jgi:hypothetical protein
MNRSEETGTTSKPDADEPSREDRAEEDEIADRTEPATPLIDQDVAGSVNAALHETDE